jgi:hypothetical protein
MDILKRLSEPSPKHRAEVKARGVQLFAKDSSDDALDQFQDIVREVEQAAWRGDIEILAKHHVRLRRGARAVDTMVIAARNAD